VAHPCNPNYSGGRGQKNQGSKSAQANSLHYPILKNSHPKKFPPTGESVGAPVVEQLSMKHEGLSSNHSPDRKKKKKG
jgi:hypothetical protein